MSEALDDIRQRAGAATKGPWETTQAADEESTTWIEATSGDILHHDERGHGHMRENFAWMKRADAEFIAHARTDIPRLLGALDTVLAIADDLISDITGADGVEDEAQGEIRDQIAGRIRAVVNDALESGK